MKNVWQVLGIFLLMLEEGWSQCAMCRTTLENSMPDEGAGISAGVNSGIMYLFFTPYLAIAAVAFFWYRISKKNAKSHNADS